MIFQDVVKFRRQRAQFRQIVPRDGRQIVVLVVVTHVQTQQIDRAIITVRLLFGVVCVVFLDQARPNGWQANEEKKRKKKTKNKKKNAPPSHRKKPPPRRKPRRRQDSPKTIGHTW